MSYQLVYVSTPDEGLKINEVQDIVDKARVNNRDKSITGFLCGNSSFFIQCIEGEEQQIKNLFKTIKNDKRHSNIKVLRQCTIEDRNFGNWNMGVVLGMEKHTEVLQRYSHEEYFNPYDLDGQESVQMLLDFSKVRGF